MFVNAWDSNKHENHNSITWFGNYFQNLTLHEKWHILMHMNKITSQVEQLHDSHEIWSSMSKFE
jgi:hypothetical protein